MPNFLQIHTEDIWPSPTSGQDPAVTEGPALAEGAGGGCLGFNQKNKIQTSSCLGAGAGGWILGSRGEEETSQRARCHPKSTGYRVLAG